MIKALMFAAMAAAVAPASTNVGALVATEKAFASYAAENGVPAAFRHYAAPGGLVFKGGKATPVRDAYPADAKPDGSKLEWAPTLAGAASSGELGYDIGPWTSTDAKGEKNHGWFFTVWGVQPDRTWRFILDAGVVSGSGANPAPAGDTQIVAPGMTGNASNAFTDVEMAEIGMAQRHSGLTSRNFAGDGWVLRTGHEAATGKAAMELASKDPVTGYRTLGGGASASGDMAYMYGEAAWKGGRGHYVRIWVRRAGVWKVLIDSIVPAA